MGLGYSGPGSKVMSDFHPNNPYTVHFSKNNIRDDFLKVPGCFSFQITGLPQESMVTMVKPGLPTRADLYMLPTEDTPTTRSGFADKVLL